MWFRFPDGVTEISVEQHNYSTEVQTEVEGEVRRYFRAPDHFAPQILGLTPCTHETPPGDHADLPPTQLSSANAQLAGQIEVLKNENSALQADLSRVVAEFQDQRGKLLEAEARLKNAEADLEEAQAKIVELEGSRKK